MAEGERRSLVWAIKKDLLTLSADELFQIAKSLGPVPGVDQSCLKSGDEDSCFEYISGFMCSKALLESEDQGMSHLLSLKDVVDAVTQGHVSDLQIQAATGNDSCDLCPNAQPHDVSVEVSPTNAMFLEDGHNSGTEVTDSVTQNTSSTAVSQHDVELQKILFSYEELSKKIKQYMPTSGSQLTSQTPSQAHCRSTPHNDGLVETHAPMRRDKVVSLRDLAYLHRREFKIHGGQIGDQGSDISYNSICRQIEEGLKEQFNDAEIVRAVMRVIKPGNFKDMLMNKDELTVEELKDFLHSHLGEQNNTELFQELMCTKQSDSETPQQFLYRVIGLKQKILLTSKHTNSDVKYSASTVQDVFLHTVYQGLGHKHSDIRRELKPLLADANVTDEAILKQMKKVMSDESERQRRLGSVTRQRNTNVHSTQVEINGTQCPVLKEENAGKRPKVDMIQQLSEKVEKPASIVEQMTQSLQTTAEQSSQYRKTKTNLHRERKYGCEKCIEQDRPDCPHCFHCGEGGHRAVGCMKKTIRQGNGSRSLSRDKQ
ncbi:unnamed protein product [Oreochromis niloticus]|nr:unnamed protein product [Mustela putorius furo]